VPFCKRKKKKRHVSKTRRRILGGREKKKSFLQDHLKKKKVGHVGVVEKRDNQKFLRGAKRGKGKQVGVKSL